MSSFIVVAKVRDSKRAIASLVLIVEAGLPAQDHLTHNFTLQQTTNKQTEYVQILNLNVTAQENYSKKVH